MITSLLVSKIMIGFSSCKINELKLIQSMPRFRILEECGIFQMNVSPDYDNMGIVSKIHIGLVHRCSSFNGNYFFE